MMLGAGAEFWEPQVPVLGPKTYSTVDTWGRFLNA